MRLTAQQFILFLAVVCFGAVFIAVLFQGGRFDPDWRDLLPLGLAFFAWSHL